jgi:2'-5' RNA ligase
LGSAISLLFVGVRCGGLLGELSEDASVNVVMSLLVVAYPHLTQTDHEWIQAIRRQHDPQYGLIGAHFTLVFPVTTVDQDAFIAHVTARLRYTYVISFNIRCAMVVKDAFGPLTHVFLVPDEGFSALVKLHDALYTDVLADALRLDAPFIPHITVGGDADPLISKALADAINREDRCVQGQITALDIISYEQGNIVPVTRITLAE